MSSDLAKEIVVAALEENAVAMREHVDVALSARVKTIIDDYKEDFAATALDEVEDVVDLDEMSEEDFAGHILEMDASEFEEFCAEHEIEDDDIEALEEMRANEAYAVDDMYTGKTKGKKKKDAKLNKEDEDEDSENDIDEMKSGESGYWRTKQAATKSVSTKKAESQSQLKRPGNYFGNRGAMKKYLRAQQDRQDERVYGKKG